jgi:hypothetical protein
VDFRGGIFCGGVLFACAILEMAIVYPGKAGKKSGAAGLDKHVRLPPVRSLMFFKKKWVT